MRHVSPWAVAGVLVWTLVMIGAPYVAIPLFTNVSGSALECSAASCTRQYGSDWLGVLVFSVIAASVAAGLLVVLLRLLGVGRGTR